MLSPIDQYVPQSAPEGSARRAQVLMWGCAAALALFPVSMIMIAPLALAHGHEALARGIYQAFSPFCHQIPERSFHLDGHAFAVCARCTGLYAGFAGGILFYPLARSLKHTLTPALLWLFLAVIPLAVDWSLGFFNIWANTHLSRLLTGTLLGAVAAFYVVPGLMDLLRVEEQAKKITASLVPERIAPSDYGSPSSRI